MEVGYRRCYTLPSSVECGCSEGCDGTAHEATRGFYRRLMLGPNAPFQRTGIPGCSITVVRSAGSSWRLIVDCRACPLMLCQDSSGEFVVTTQSWFSWLAV